MAKGEIKTKLVLEGEAEYKRQMTDAANAIKVLDSEQKLAEAQFKATGDAQQYAADKARILREKMAEQQKAVDAAQKAMEALQSKGVEKNSKSMQTWSSRLNTAKTRLYNLQSELNSTQTELGEQQQAVEGVSGSYEALGTTAQNIDKKITLEQAISAVDNLKNKVEAVIKAGYRATKALWTWESDAGQWADDLMTAASSAGMDVETYQSWQYASQFIDTNVSDITSTITKLEKDLGSTSKEMAAAFNQIGVVTRNQNGTVRDATAVFWDTVDALSRVSDETTRSIYAQQLLGSSWKSLNPLIEAGSAAYKAMAEEGRQVAVVSEEDVAQLGNLNDAQTRLNSALNKTKYEVLATLAPAFTAASDAMATAVNAFNDFLHTEEGQAALDQLGAAFQGVVDQLTSVDAKTLIENAAGAVRKFTSALNWISEHGDAVTAILIGLGAAWAGLTVTKEVLEFARLLSVINWSKIGSSGGGSGAMGAAADAVTGAASGAGASSGGGFWSKVAAGAAALITKAEAAALVATGVEAGANMVKEVKEQGTLLGTGPGNTDDEGNWQLGQSGIYINTRAISDAWQNFIGGFTGRRDYGGYIDAAESGRVDQAIEDARTGGQRAYADALEAFTEGLAQFESGEGVGAIKEAAEQNADLLSQIMPDLDTSHYDALDWISLATDATTKLTELVEQAGSAGQNAGEAFETGLEQTASDAADAATTVGDGVNETLEEEYSFLDIIGANAGQGFANGLASKVPAVVTAAASLADAATNTLNSRLRIASPSKVWREKGGNTGEGYALGIEDKINRVERAVGRMTDATTRQPAAAARTPAAGRGSGGDVHAYIVMDKRVVGEMTAPVVDGYIGAQIATRR